MSVPLLFGDAIRTVTEDGAETLTDYSYLLEASG
jgi:hypothetical protein